MSLDVPTMAELRATALLYQLELSDADLESFQATMGQALKSYERLDELARSTPLCAPTRDGGRPPDPQENRLNGWVWRCSVKETDSGVLAGKRVAIKDNVCMAGLPMRNGCSLLEGYVPDFDATIVKRILASGGEIVGKASCEYLSFSGSSFTADSGPVLNPHDPSRTSGGSSSGSAALVAVNECDCAVGGDQGGSIRIPTSFCGVYGLKPTYGLVPYTGVFPIEMTLDHVGPIGASVDDVARLLEAIAGPDAMDPRQHRSIAEPIRYSYGLDEPLTGLNIGIVAEGFGWEGVSEPDVDEAVEESAWHFERLGARVCRTSIPMHRDAIHIWQGIMTEGAFDTMIRGHAAGTNWKGFYPVSLMDAFARGRAGHADRLSDPVKFTVLLGQHLQSRCHGRYYAIAQNLSPLLIKAYDDALAEVDVLVMPTSPMKATLLPVGRESPASVIARVTEMGPNVYATDVTGHPSISIPCAMSNGLPVGMMLVGRQGADATLLRAARAYEESGRYKGNPQRDI